MQRAHETLARQQREALAKRIRDGWLEVVVEATKKGGKGLCRSEAGETGGKGARGKLKKKRKRKRMSEKKKNERKSSKELLLIDQPIRQ